MLQAGKISTICPSAPVYLDFRSDHGSCGVSCLDDAPGWHAQIWCVILVLLPVQPRIVRKYYVVQRQRWLELRIPLMPRPILKLLA
jgi:hypothetical protein